jgi:hypothetical protein
MTTYRLLIAIERPLPNWPLVEELLSFLPNPAGSDADLPLPPTCSGSLIQELMITEGNK